MNIKPTLSLSLKLLLFFLVFVWVIGIFIEFFIPIFDNLSYLYPYLTVLYSHVCHQQPEKILSINGQSLLVCSRCSGIYLGSFISTIILFFLPSLQIKKIKFLIFAVIPMLIDVILYSIGVYSYSKEVALFSGILFGIAGIIYIYNGFRLLLLEKRKGEN